MSEQLTIAGVGVAPGQRRTIDLPMPRLYTHAELTMPIQVIRGKRPGPTLFLSAAIHGDEITGVEIIRRLLALKALRRLRGTLLAIPIVNSYGLINHSRYLPDRRDLNRSFPGSANGSLAARLAHSFLNQIVVHCDYGIDLHSGANHRKNLPQIRACLNKPETLELARVFGAPVVLDSRMRDGSLREAAHQRGITTLLYEAGEALRFDEAGIRIGIRGILAVMRHIGMLPKRRETPARFEPVVASKAQWTRAPISGILKSAAPLGAQVKRGELLGTIADPFGENEKAVRAEHAGVIVGRLNLPLVHQGDALFNIALGEADIPIDTLLNDLEESWPMNEPEASPEERYPL